MKAIKMVLKINVNTTITMITWSDWPVLSVCKGERKGNIYLIEDNVYVKLEC